MARRLLSTESGVFSGREGETQWAQWRWDRSRARVRLHATTLTGTIFFAQTRVSHDTNLPWYSDHGSLPIVVQMYRRLSSLVHSKSSAATEIKFPPQGLDVPREYSFIVNRLVGQGTNFLSARRSFRSRSQVEASCKH